MESPQLASFLEARDFLRAHRTDYDAACRGFRWPPLDQFNWALDYFDRMAAAVFPEHVGPFLVRGAGHFLQWEAAHLLNQTIRYFCGR